MYNKSLFILFITLNFSLFASEQEKISQEKAYQETLQLAQRCIQTLQASYRTLNELQEGLGEKAYFSVFQPRNIYNNYMNVSKMRSLESPYTKSRKKLLHEDYYRNELVLKKISYTNLVLSALVLDEDGALNFAPLEREVLFQHGYMDEDGNEIPPVLNDRQSQSNIQEEESEKHPKKNNFPTRKRNAKEFNKRVKEVYGNNMEKKSLEKEDKGKSSSISGYLACFATGCAVTAGIMHYMNSSIPSAKL